MVKTVSCDSQKKLKTIQMLISKAKEASSYSMSHISKFKVGAAILSDTGNVYLGCNIEFDNYSNTIHAEEAAISGFVLGGEKVMKMIAVYTIDKQLWFPCGMCRQSLFELGGHNLEVIACNDKKYSVMTMVELLPLGFRLR